jgi:hypothetical protein
MKTVQTKQTMKLGDLIAAVYDACGTQKAKGILRLALDAHLVTFRGRNPRPLPWAEPQRASPVVTPTLLWRALSRTSRST